MSALDRSVPLGVALEHAIKLSGLSQSEIARRVAKDSRIDSPAESVRVLISNGVRGVGKMNPNLLDAVCRVMDDELKSTRDSGAALGLMPKLLRAQSLLDQASSLVETAQAEIHASHKEALAACMEHLKGRDQ